MNEYELPDDIKALDRMYQSPEEIIEGLENIIMEKNKVILDLKKQLFGHNVSLHTHY